MVGALLLYLLLAEQFETICTFRRAQVRLSKYRGCRVQER